MISDTRAKMNRELIRAANEASYTAESVKSLIRFCTKTYDDKVADHPSFPYGVLYAFENEEKKRGKAK